MFIKKISLKDYKRFHDLTIDLGSNPQRIIALVGPNGCGKSSVFDAILSFTFLWAGVIGENFERDYRYHSLTQDPTFFDHPAIKIEYTEEGNLSDIRTKREEQGNTRSSLSFRSSYRYNSKLSIREISTHPPIKENKSGASLACSIDSRIETNYRSLLAYLTDYMQANDARPSEANSYVIGSLNDAIRRCLDIEIVSLGNVANGEGTIFFKKSDTQKAFQYNVLSSGEKEVVDILIDLFLRREFYNDSIYIIDEPELHLHTAMQRKLLLEINKMIPENCQIWIATHSIGFIRALQDELREIVQIIEFPADNKWASEVYTLSPSVPSHTMWRRIFSTALDDLAMLICPKKLVYCEGRDMPGTGGRERGLDAIVYNTLFARQYPDVLFISSGGNTELDSRSDIAIQLLSKALPDLEIFVLKDRDCASGKPVTEAMRQEYLETNPESHRILKRFEIENYLYDKPVLAEYCLRNGRAFDESFYDGIITDIVNQELKSRTSEIKRACGIDTSISQEVFKKKLAECIDPSMTVYQELERIIFFRE